MLRSLFPKYGATMAGLSAFTSLAPTGRYAQQGDTTGLLCRPRGTIGSTGYHGRECPIPAVANLGATAMGRLSGFS